MSAPAPHPPGFWRGFWIIALLELKQRLRSKALLVLAIVWFCVIGIVTAASWIAITAFFGAMGSDADGFPLFSIIVYFVLLFGTLVTPAVSAGSIGAERSQATLATTQVTLVGTWSILLGKAFAAWITGIAFLVVAAPFIVFSLVLSDSSVGQLSMALLAIALQMGVFTVIGVGLSALVQSQVFAIVIAYLVVALLSVGTLIAFGLSAAATTTYVEVEDHYLSDAYWDEVSACGSDEECQAAVPETCASSTYPSPYSPTQRIWWILALNPYVVVADMVPPTLERGEPVDLFGGIAVIVRSLQHEPETPTGWDECAPPGEGPVYPGLTTQEVYESTVPVWWIGLGLQVLLAAAVLFSGYRRLDTPARKLPRGSRVA